MDGLCGMMCRWFIDFRIDETEEKPDTECTYCKILKLLGCIFFTMQIEHEHAERPEEKEHQPYDSLSVIPLSIAFIGIIIDLIIVSRWI